MFSTPRRRQAAWFVIGLLSSSLALLALVAIVQTRDLATAIRQSQKERASTFEILVDCTDPSGKCYQRGQEQTATAVGDINKITIYAAACADEPKRQTLAEIQTCVLERLAADERR